MLTKLEEWKLDRLRKQYPELATATPEQILDCAILDEQFARDCVFDPAGYHFALSMHDLERMALLTEKSLQTETPTGEKDEKEPLP